MRLAPRGMTLVEVLVAVVLVAGIAGATTIALSQSLRARSASAALQEARSRADVAASRIARDVGNAIREGDLYYARVLVVDEEERRQPRDEILVFAGSLDTARPRSAQPEGGMYEVQYRAAELPAEVRRAAAARGAEGTDTPLVLWRRVDPVPDEVPEGGGVAFPVVEGLESLSVEAWNGRSWYDAWDSDRDGYPHAIRITVTARDRTGRSAATARRIVALDRVPLPYVAIHTDEPDGAEGGDR